MKKPQPFYAQWNQPPKNARQHGKYRRTSPPAYGSSVVGADNGTRGTNESGTVTTWTAISSVITWPELPNPKPPAVTYAGIRAGEIVGHRLWWVIAEAGADWLCSLAHRRLWMPEETVLGNTQEMVEGCFFYTIWGGTYAFTKEESCRMEIEIQSQFIKECMETKRCMAWGWVAPRETSTFVRGTIKMWGDVIEHERGYRAEFAKVNSIDEMYGPGDLHELRARYGVNH